MAETLRYSYPSLARAPSVPADQVRMHRAALLDDDVPGDERAPGSRGSLRRSQTMPAAVSAEAFGDRVHAGQGGKPGAAPKPAAAARARGRRPFAAQEAAMAGTAVEGALRIDDLAAAERYRRPRAHGASLARRVVDVVMEFGVADDARDSLVSQITISASAPMAMVPFARIQAVEFGGLRREVSATMALMSRRPSSTPWKNSSGRRVSRPGMPLGT